jgi:anaerobic selenocysteine-containing dehydrogenase
MRQGRPSGRGFLAQFEARLSLTAAAADEWIPAQLGTEGLIALALGRIIVEENLGRVGSHRPYAHFYRGVEPGALAETAGIPIGRLQQLARFFAEAQSPLAIPGGVLSGLSNGEQSMDAVMALNVIMRRIGREGGVFLAQSPPRQRFAATEHSATFHELDELSDAMRKGEIDLLFIYGTNPLFELPIWAGLHEGLKRVSKIVSFSSQVDETTLWADLVLPDHTYLESWGYHIPSPGADRPVVSSLQPVVTPLYDTRATADVLLTLASSLGGPIAEALPWSSEIAFLEEASEELFDSSLGSYDARTPGGFWSKWRQSGGWWSEKSLRREPNLVSYPEDAIMIPDAWFAGNEEKYPFHLLPYPSITLSDGRGANHPLLQEVPDPMTTARWGSWIEMNPATAASMGLKENQIVRVISHNSEIEAPVLLYSGIRPDTVAMPLGQGHSSYGRFADGRGVNAINLITSLAATLSVELLWASTRVRIEPTHRFHKIARLESLAGGGRESIR